jgi:hypothetical protein
MKAKAKAKTPAKKSKQTGIPPRAMYRTVETAIPGTRKKTKTRSMAAVSAPKQTEPDEDERETYPFG